MLISPVFIRVGIFISADDLQLSALLGKGGFQQLAIVVSADNDFRGVGQRQPFLGSFLQLRSKAVLSVEVGGQLEVLCDGLPAFLQPASAAGHAGREAEGDAVIAAVTDNLFDEDTELLVVELVRRSSAASSWRTGMLAK